MAHEVETMFFYGDKPWHGLGTEVLECLTSEEAIKKAGLDWGVEKRDIWVYDEGQASYQRVADHFAVVRMTDGRPLGVVGRKYTPLQNEKAFCFFDEIVGSKEAIYETAGSLRGGRIVWMLAKLPGSIGTKEDPIDKYLVLSNSHDGSHLVKIMVTPVRVVCMNTLNAAIVSTLVQFEVRHTASVLSKVEDARIALKSVSAYFQQLDGLLNVLRAKRMSEAEIKTYVHGLFPSKVKAETTDTFGDTVNLEYGEKVKKHIETVMNLVETGKGTDLPGVKGTAYGTLNAAIEFADHFHPVRGKANPLEKRLDSIWFGSAQRFKQKALDTIVEYAQAA